MFKKKSVPLSELPAEDRWDVAEGERDGQPMLVRVNASARKFAGHPEMPVRLGIAIPFLQPDERGFPSKDDLAVLNQIEDQLVASVNGSGRGRLTLVITTGGMREFLSYVRTSEDANEVAQHLRSLTTSHEVQDYSEADPKWTAFRHFV